MSDQQRLLDERRARYRAEETESLRREGDGRQLKRLLKYLQPRRNEVLLAIALSLVIGVLSTAPMVIIKYAIDGFIVPGLYKGLIMICGLLILVNAVLFFIEQYTQYLISRIGQRTMHEMRMDIFRHVQAQPLRFFDKNPVGRLITRITSDVNALNELFAQGIVGIFQQIFMLFVILGVLFYYNWYLTLWVLPVIPVILLASWNFRNQVFFSYRLSRVRLSRLNAFMQENVTGMRTVQANTREGDQFSHFRELNDDHRQAHLKTVFQYAIFFPIVELLAVVGISIVLWKAGVASLGEGALVAITVGQLGLFIQALDRFFEPIKDLSEKYNVVQSALAAADRLFALMDTKPAITDVAHPAVARPFEHTIEFRDVWFAYNDEQWVLKGVSFTINRGETIAIVGPTGSGKTTLMSLLCRFYDIQKGAILIDGVDIRELRQADLRQKIAIVLQDVFLFYGTVADNVRLGNRAIPDAKLKQVCEEVGFDEFVRAMPKGYDSGVRERGATLSTGQKQLLSFARALAFDPEILVLDEATANIDTATEQKVQAAVAKLCAGRTALVIAHRLSTIQSATRILVIHHGHLAEQGTHEELLSRGGLYKKLYDLQYKDQAGTAA